MLAEHALGTTAGRADQAAERLGILRRTQQRHLGWMEAHDEALRVQERAVAREDAWRRRVDQRALALDPPGWLLAELGPVPTDPQARTVWRVAAAELDGYRRAYGLHPPGSSKHVGGRDARDRRAAAPTTSLAGEAADGTHGQLWRRSRDAHTNQPNDRPSRPMVAADQRHRTNPGRLLGSEPRRNTLGRRRDWLGARAALERLADHHRHRDHRQRPPERLSRLRNRDRGRDERDGR